MGPFCQGLTLPVGRSKATRKRPEKETESSSQLQESGETETTSKAVIELLLEQQDDAARGAAGAVSNPKGSQGYSVN